MDRAILKRRSPRRTTSIQTTIGLAAGVLALMFVLGPAASALPNSGGPLEQQCGDLVRVFQHPGSGIALWEVTTQDVTNGPNYLIKDLELDISVNGGPPFHVSRVFGNKTGHGDSFICYFTESFTDADGNSVVVLGTSYKVPV